MLLGCIVITRYNNKTYKVDDILWKNNPTNSFPVRDFFLRKVKKVVKMVIFTLFSARVSSASTWTTSKSGTS